MQGSTHCKLHYSVEPACIKMARLVSTGSQQFDPLSVRERPAGRRKPVPSRPAPKPPARPSSVSRHYPVYNCNGDVPLPSKFVQLPAAAQIKDSTSDAKNLQPNSAAVGKKTQPTSGAGGVCQEMRNSQAQGHGTAASPHHSTNDCNGTVASAYPAVAQATDSIADAKGSRPTSAQASLFGPRPQGPPKRPVLPKRISPSRKTAVSSHDPTVDCSGPLLQPKDSITEAKKLQPSSAMATQSSPSAIQPPDPPVPPRRLTSRSTASSPSPVPANARSKDSTTDAKKQSSATAVQNSLPVMPVPPKRSSSLREQHRSPVVQKRNDSGRLTLLNLSEEDDGSDLDHGYRGNTFPRVKAQQTTEQRKESIRPSLFSLSKEDSFSNPDHGYRHNRKERDTFPRANPRKTTAQVERTSEHATRKKQKKPHVIDARPTLYEPVEYTESRQTWLQRIRSRHMQRKEDESTEKVNHNASGITKRRHHSATVPPQKDSSTAPQGLTLRSPPHKRPPSMPTRTLFQRLTSACDGEPKRPQMPLPTAACDGELKRPQMPLPTSPPLHPITESDHEDCTNTGDSGNVEDEDNLSPYSVVKHDRQTGRLVYVTVNPVEIPQLSLRLQHSTDEEADEYIYPLGQLNLPPSESAGASMDGSTAAQMAPRDSGVYTALDCSTRVQDGEYTSVRFGEGNSITAPAQPVNISPGEGPDATSRPKKRNSYENVPPPASGNHQAYYVNVKRLTSAED